MLHRVNFSFSSVCDLKSCFAYYFEGSNVCRRTPASIRPNAQPFEERSMNKKKVRKTDVEKPKGSEKRKPVSHPFQKKKTLIWTAMGSNPDFFGEKVLSFLSHEA